MKQLVLIVNLIILFIISSCATQRDIASNSNDDVYANPKEDRIEEQRIAAEKRTAREARDKRYNDSIAAVKRAQQEKDDANPYYKDREFKYDDYYDYEYATRVKRFDNNIQGLGYYDNYYTNSYWYNQNPYNYGVSVYNGYSWWGQGYNNYSYNPSVSFYMNYGWGNNYGYGGYNGYNPYDPYASAYWQGYNNGYNQGYNNGWGGYPYYSIGYGYGYNPYGYGYNPYGGYGYNPYNNGWGYYNAYDQNSSYTYGPRASHTGNNSPRTSNPGVRGEESYYQKYVSTVVKQQELSTKFDDHAGIRTNPVKYNTGTGATGGSVKNPSINNNGTVKNPVRNNGTEINSGGNQQTSQPVRTYDNQPVKQYETQPVKQYQQSQPVKQYESQPVKQYDEQPVKQYQQSQPVKQYETQPVKQYQEQPVQQQYQAQPIKQYEAPTYQAPSSTPSNNNGGGGVRNGGGRPR